MNVKVYVEGGGDGQALRTRCRQGFSTFLQKAGLAGRMPRIVACGGRNDAMDSFRTALKNAGPDDFPLLLVDSEAAVTEAPWPHLARRDGWQRPAGASEDQAQLMVQCMEAWLLADGDALARYFGQGFRPNALPSNPLIEQIPKASVFDGLKQASRETKTKGRYDKGEHSFAILCLVDPDKVRRSSPHAQRLIGTLDEKTRPD